MTALLLVASSDLELITAAQQAAGQFEFGFDGRPGVAEILRKLGETSNDKAIGCIVVDLAEPGAVAELAKLKPLAAGAPILGVVRPHDLKTAVLAMRHGAADVVERPLETATLTERLQILLDESQEARQEHARAREFRTRLAALPHNQRSVLEGVLQSKSNKDIAAAMGVSLRSIELWRSRLMKSLGVTSLADLVRASRWLNEQR